jgi:hypothetical protein
MPASAPRTVSGRYRAMYRRSPHAPLRAAETRRPSRARGELRRGPDFCESTPCHLMIQVAQVPERTTRNPDTGRTGVHQEVRRRAETRHCPTPSYHNRLHGAGYGR